MSVRLKHRILLGISVLATLGIFFLPRIPQDPLYHQFADQVSLLGIPNGLDVLSNLFFAWVGALGLYRLYVERSLKIVEQVYPAYLGFFLSLILIAAGSAYYHWAPDNLTLLWDRIPITLASMSLICVLLAERISIRLAKNLYPLLVVLGIASSIYWIYSEQIGQGDLRPYILIQFLPILLAPLILAMMPSAYTRSGDLWWFVAWYLVSRVCEVFDREILEWLGWLSGHTLKHVTASIGCLIFLRHLRLRQSLGDA